jgi:hypothetical protein
LNHARAETAADIMTERPPARPEADQALIEKYKNLPYTSFTPEAFEPRSCGNGASLETGASMWWEISWPSGEPFAFPAAKGKSLLYTRQ